MISGQPAILPRPVLLLAGYGNSPFERFTAALIPLDLDLALDVRITPYGWDERYRGERFLREIELTGAAPRARHAVGLGNLGHQDKGPMRLADPAQLDLLVTRLSEGLRVVVICGCAQGSSCHRALIGREILLRAPDVPIFELGPVGRSGPLPQPRLFESSDRSDSEAE